MVGITGYGAYIPLFRLGPGTKGWTFSNEKAVANFDEDSLTMAAAAAINCLSGINRQTVDALYFASTTSPYVEKQCAATIATVADLQSSIFTMDCTNTTRAATIAFRAAFDAVKAGTSKCALVTASDIRLAQARSDFEANLGDGAAALMIGDTDVAVTIEDSYSMADEITDIWRSEGDKLLRSWEDRFVLEQGYLKVLPVAVNALLKKNNLTIKDFARVAIYAPDGRRLQEMARKIGADMKTQVQDVMFSYVGNTGAALVPMMLISILENAKPGDRILMANYGNGADAFILKATDKIGNIKNRRGISKNIQSKIILDDYQKYTNWRGLLDVAPATRRPPMPIPSAAALKREVDQNIRFHGTKCKACGYPQYPPQRVCTRCHAKDQMESYRFSDKPGTIFTYANDYVGLTPDPPLVISAVNFDGGGRVIMQMTDRDINDLKIGLPVEATFRKLFDQNGVHNYFWKTMPKRA